MPAAPAAILTALLLATPAPADDGLQSVELIRDRGLTVCLTVKRRASLADEEWIALELRNQGQQPLTIHDVAYALQADRENLKTGQRVGGDSLGGGNSGQLFPDATPHRWLTPLSLGPGRVVRVAAQPSEYTAALLGAAPPDGLRVRATGRARVTLERLRSVVTADSGVPFEFEWLPPAGGSAALTARLRTLLDTPQQFWAHGDLLAVMLDDPALAAAASRDQLLAGVTRRMGRGGFGADAIARALVRRCPDDRGLAAVCGQQIASGTTDALLLVGSGVWHPSFADPLVRMLAADSEHLSRALFALRRLRALGDHGTAATAGLSAAVRQAAPALGNPAVRVADQNLSDWSQMVQRVGATGDRAMVQFLRPALDDRRKIFGDEAVARMANTPHRPRACDEAANAILTLLGEGEMSAAWAAAVKQGPLPASVNRAAEEADRACRRAPSTAALVAVVRSQESRYEHYWDRVIGDLQIRLAQPAP